MGLPLENLYHILLFLSYRIIKYFACEKLKFLPDCCSFCIDISENGMHLVFLYINNATIFLVLMFVMSFPVYPFNGENRILQCKIDFHA